ncbi:MAG: tRNA pseudouridine(38-40) synthase TruA [Spirochaetes bacterium]|nr:tRNA pseudouridine(38-40) synthase TruA [Spirochaetota bacterium]
MSRRNIRVVLAYDGTDFFGWQNQKEGRTVQAVVEQALAKIHKHPVHVHAAGRTDSGVHAAGQVINFFTDLSSIPSEKFTPALNSILPFDVRALVSEEVDESFHARFDARLREYRYYIYPQPIVPPYFRRYCHWIAYRPHLGRLNRMASYIVGTHDFTSFSALGDPNPSKVRTVQSAAFFPQGPFLVFRITGTSFLWHMVRNLVGTFLMLDQEERPPEQIREILEAKDRDLAGDTAPASGLFLHRVIYDNG